MIIQLIKCEEVSPPLDREIILFTSTGVVSAWFDAETDEWVCYDDMFSIAYDTDIFAWCEKPEY